MMRLKPEKRRWLIVGIIFLAIVFNYVDRQIVSILKPMLKDEFQIGDDGYAFILNVFTICYALMYPISGWLVDRFGPRKVMLYGILTWTVACLGGGISRTLGQFTFFRGMLGVAEPSNFPAQIRVVTVWFSDRMRATANSLCVAGSSVGAIIAPPFIAWLALSHSWHMAFIVSGAVGLLIVLLWALIYRDPPAGFVQPAQATAAVATGTFKWASLWKTRSLWGILLIRFISDPVWYFCLFWLPGYLQENSGLSLAQVGMFGWIPFLFADLGAVGTSAWSDRLVRKGIGSLKARKIMLTTVSIAAPLCLIIPYVSNNAALTILLFSVVALMCLTWVFNTPVVMSEVFPVKNVASVLGISGGFGAAGAVLFNYFVGQFIGTLGAEKIFLMMAFLHPVAVLLLWTMVKKENPHKINDLKNEIAKDY
ncbi:MFS transporter [Niabella terrae]